MSALVDFPLDEAQGVLARLNGEHPMSAREVAAANAGERRLRQAVAVEIHASGSAEEPSGLEAIAESLVGESVRILTTHGSVKRGQLERLSGFRTLMIRGADGLFPINLSRVSSIQAERVAA